MAFTCILQRPSAGSTVVNDPKADEEAEFDTDHDSLVIVATSQLSTTDCRFEMSGFGKDSWGMNVSYDLSVVLEQLPELLAGLRAGERAEIDFYSQGVERMLYFDRQGADVVIRCVSKLDPGPPPAVEVARYEELLEMFVTLASEFAASLEMTGSRFAAMEPFVSWRAGKA